MYTRKGAGIILKDQRGRVLLQHRDKDVMNKPDHWGFFGGLIKKGETPEEAVRREAKEELGIELRNLKFFRKYDVPVEEGLFGAFIFIAPLNTSIEQLKKNQKEGQGLGLFSLEELKSLKIADHDRAMLHDLFDK
jgi:8-oxo-dGTP diphosphatase